MSYEKATIMAYLRKIHEKELVLPAIQRDFVWDEERIYRLLDSIFRNYPFGTLLFWNTKQRVQFREFTLDWSEDERYTYMIKEKGKKTTLVLDGQQRLQSLYVALFGSLDNKKLFFDLLSGNEPEDISQAKYIFQFMNSNEAEKINQDRSGNSFWVPLSEIIDIEKGGQLLAKAQKYLDILGIKSGSELGIRLSNNVGTAYFALKTDELLNFYIVDKDYGDGGSESSQDEVLEIFVRVNSGGQVLTKSDLMFSLMQLSWEGAADAIADLVEKLNKKGRFNFDKDFVLKCALVCVGEGAKYEVDKFRKEATIKKIEMSFSEISNALENCLDFIVNTGRFLDGRVLRSYNTLIPFVYYFFMQSSQEIIGEAVRMIMNQALYLSLMTAVYSRFADNYIDQVVKNIFIPAQKSQPGIFPIDAYRNFIYGKREKAYIDDWLLQNNLPLLMNILEKGRVLPEGRRSQVPEYDHIFPKSKLPEYGYSEEQINHYANMRLISAKDNNWKRNQDPKDYFSSNPEVMSYYLIPEGLLDYEKFPEFLEARREKIWKEVRTFLGISEETPTSSPPPPTIPTNEWMSKVEEIIDEKKLSKLVITRQPPITNLQKKLFKVLFDSGINGMNNLEIAEALALNPYQFAGLMGALGRRVVNTQGYPKHSGLGINLLFDISSPGIGFHYRLRPIFREVLEEEEIV
jgi:hypothetical protein